MKTLLTTFSLALALAGTAFADNIYVANTFSNTVTPVDGAKATAQAAIAVGLNPQEVAVSPRGDTVYVTDATSYEVVAIDAGNRTVRERISLTCAPSSIALMPAGTEAYIVCRTTGQVIRLDLAQKRQTAVIPVTFPHSIAVNPAGDRAYVSRSLFSRYVDVIDTATATRTATITVDRSPQGLAVSPDGTALYVANSTSGTVSVVNTSNNTVKATITVGKTPRNIAVSPDGNTIYVTNNGSGTVSVIDTATATVTSTLPAGVNPHGIALGTGGTRLYVSNYSSNTLSIIDTATLQPLATVQTGIGPLGVGVASADNTPPLTVAGLAGTGGLNGWYVSPVGITLSASDEGSGVKEIRCSVDGAAEVVTPGNTAAITLGNDGRHTISFYAVDNAGNAEPPQSLPVNIDQTAPVFTAALNRNILWPPNRKMVDVRVNGVPVDTLSGIASVVVVVADEYGVYSGTVPGAGETARLEAWRDGDDMDGRHYTITATATDNAGNSTTTFTEAIVPHDMGAR